MERLLTTDDVARVLGLMPEQVARMLKDGRIKGVKLGRLWRVFPDDLEAYLRERREAHRH